MISKFGETPKFSNLLGLFSSLRSKANLSERGRKLKSYKIETVCEMAP